MADDDQQAPQQRSWFPYWTSPPQQPPPRPVLRQQLSRRDTRSAPPPVTPSPSRRQPQPQPAAAMTPALRGAGDAGLPQAQPRPTRLSSRPSPSRSHPLSPIREPNSSAPPATASATKEAKPASHPQPEVPQELDIVVPQEKIIHEPPSDNKAHSKAVEKEKEEEKDKDKEKEKKEHKEKEKDKEHKDKKEKEKDHKEKEKEHKEKEKEKDKEHKEKKDKEKHKEEHKEKEKEHKESGGKLHKELKAGVADMVHKLGATAAPSPGHHHASGTGGTTVITLAGENKGATMKVSHAADQAESNKERGGRKLDDGKHQENRGGPKGMTAFVNSNVQVVNNSLVLQSSCSSSDPGVHLKLAAKAKKKGDGGGDKVAVGKGGAAAAPAGTKKK